MTVAYHQQFGGSRDWNTVRTAADALQGDAPRPALSANAPAPVRNSRREAASCLGKIICLSYGGVSTRSGKYTGTLDKRLELQAHLPDLTQPPD